MSKRIEFFLIAVFSFVLLNRLVLADPPYYNCSIQANFTLASPFAVNRDNLLSSLSINASTLNYSEFSVGNGKDRIYGNFLCYSTVSRVTCQNCMKTAVEDIKRRCPTNMEAFVWEDNCQLRYSYVKFFGVMDHGSIRIADRSNNFTNTTLFNKLTISDPDGFRAVVKDFMRNLSRVAAFGSSSKRYALEEDKKYTENENISGLVQCTRDLSGNDCNICLQKAISDIQTCCYFYRGARVLSRSCYLRYELYHLTEAEAQAELPGEPNKRQSNKLSIVIILVIAASAVVVIFLCSWLCHYIYGKQKQKESTIELTTQEVYQNNVVTPIRANSLRQRDEMRPKDFPLITLATINEITNHFSDLNILGQGGFGPVYKGVLSDGKEVAVKRLSISSEQGSEEFMNEIILIMKLQHKNLVKLLGCCIEKEEKILVYEYMPNRSLDVFIFDSQRRAQLNWRKRLDIITGIARGLLYLHQDSRLRIIHRDLKASNVLLDENMNPKISDFGMARIFAGNHGEEANTKIIVGTYGYMAPEYAMEGLYSTKSDVYSFGVLLIEIVTGKRNARSNLSRSAPSLLAYAWKLWNEGNVFELIDPLLIESCSASAIQFQRYINIGLLCVQEDANTRPSMSSVVVMLVNECVPVHQPLRPAFSVVRVAAQSDQNLDCSINGLTISSILPR